MIKKRGLSLIKMRNIKLDNLIEAEKADVHERYKGIKDNYERFRKIASAARKAFLGEIEDQELEEVKHGSDIEALENYDLLTSMRYFNMRSLAYLLTDLTDLLPFNERMDIVSKKMRKSLNLEKITDSEKAEAVFEYFIKERVKDVRKKLADYERKLEEVSCDESLKYNPEFSRRMRETYGRLKFEVEHIKPIDILQGLEINYASDLLLFFGNDNNILDKHYTKAQNIRRYEMLLDALCNIHDKYERGFE